MCVKIPQLGEAEENIEVNVGFRAAKLGDYPKYVVYYLLRTRELGGSEIVYVPDWLSEKHVSTNLLPKLVTPSSLESRYVSPPS